MAEVASTQPEVQTKCIGHIYDVLHESRALVAERHGGFSEVEFVVALPEEERRRHKFVEHVLEAHSDFMLQVGVPTQLGLLGPVHHPRIEPKLEIVLPRGERELVIGVGGVDIEEHFVGHHVVPSRGDHRVAPRDGRPEPCIRTLKAEHVTPEIP